MSVGVYRNGYSGALQFIPPAAVRKEPSLVKYGLRVDFYNYTGCRGMRHHIVDKRFIPFLRLDRGVGECGVPYYFVKVA